MVAELGRWYSKEQVKELAKFQHLNDRLKVLRERGNLLIVLDGKMVEMAGSAFQSNY